MPAPSGINEARVLFAATQLDGTRMQLRNAAKDADEAHAPELHRRIMAAITAVDDALDESTTILKTARERLR